LLKLIRNRQQFYPNLKHSFMKKLLYAFMAILFASASTKAQTNPCEGKANFQFTINTSTVSFFSLNTSNVVLNHRWTFGDGNTSDMANPVHTYQFPGNYRVVHYIKDATQNCYDSIVKEFQLTFTTPCDLLQPKFEWKRDSANPAKIIFMNLSQPNAPPTTIIYKWSFGDGTYSTEKNPTHLYSTTGQFEVCLSISYPNTNCIKRYCTIVSVPPPCNLQAYFSWALAATNPLTIKFTNQTITTTANAEVKWSFGDGTYSTEWTPTHTYTKAGIYKVCIRVAISTTCVQEFCKEVVVRDCNIETDFKWAIDSVFPLRGVKFYPLPSVLTIAPLSVKWSFGDGTYSTEYSPFHQYQQPGTYKVCLRIEYYAGCVKEVCKEITIPVPVNCEKLSEFKYERITSISNAFVFAALTQVSTLKYTWTFGDGTGALGPNAKHQYERPGKYTVCLTVYRGDNCASTTCKEIVVGPLNCEQTYVKFEYQRLNAIGNIIKFKAISNQPVLYQKWSILKDNGTVPVILTTQDPTYTFTQAGVYKVCLRAITGNGCVKEYCEVITIHNAADACTLQLTPNPATTQITFKIELAQQAAVVASIVDMSGVRRAVFYLNGTQGWNSYTLPVSTLPTGYYTLEVKVGDRICKGRFQKLN
jgi:PKD repeat protein